MKKLNSVYLERVIEMIFYIGIIIIVIIASIAEEKDYHVNFIAILTLGIYLLGLILNFMYKTTKVKTEKWKKNIILIIYIFDMIYILYSILIKSFNWIAYVFAFNLLLVSIEFRKRADD